MKLDCSSGRLLNSELISRPTFLTPESYSISASASGYHIFNYLNYETVLHKRYVYNRVVYPIISLKFLLNVLFTLLVKFLDDVFFHNSKSTILNIPPRFFQRTDFAPYNAYVIQNVFFKIFFICQISFIKLLKSYRIKH